MIEVIRALEKQPISLSIMQRACPIARVIAYDKLPPRGTIESIIGRKKALIVLYTMHNKRGQKKEGVGHFACVLPLGKQRYEYFSSYGFPAEKELHMTHSKGRLLNLLGKNYIRSSARLQKKFNTQTCARWAAARAFLHELPLAVFTKYFTKRTILAKPDDIVTCATLFAFRG